MKNCDSKYFLAANSCEGFKNYFGSCYNPKDNWRCYIIKGGPGTGKSSFMKKVAKYAENENEKYILCPCSSDPQSLDAIILPNKKTVILDGTAPHTIDPIYPGVCEEILNFGMFWDSSKITDKNEIISITDQNKAIHKSVSKYLNAAGQIMLDSYKIALSYTKKAEAKTFAERLIKKHIPKNSGTPYEWVRFIEGITPEGIISYPETVTKECQNIIVVSDKYRACSNIIMSEIRNYCLINGYEIITLKNPFLPSVIIDHIVIPKLSLAFVTEDSRLLFETPTRRIHSRRFTSNKMLHKSVSHLKLNHKVINSLLDTAVNTLREAKSVHDALEKHYIDIMNYSKLQTFENNFCKTLF